MTNEQMQQLDRERALDNAIACLGRRARDFADAATELQRRIDDLKKFENPEHVERMATASDLFNWSINDVENVVRNLNFAEMARVGARLSATE